MHGEGDAVIVPDPRGQRNADRLIPGADAILRVIDLTAIHRGTERRWQGGKRFRVYYVTQTGTRPFRMKLFCNREEKLTEQYRRYLEAGLVEEFGLQGCPIYFDLVGKEKNDPNMSFASKMEAADKAKRPAPFVPKWKASEEAETDSTHETLED